MEGSYPGRGARGPGPAWDLWFWALGFRDFGGVGDVRYDLSCIRWLQELSPRPVNLSEGSTCPKLRQLNHSHATCAAGPVADTSRRALQRTGTGRGHGWGMVASVLPEPRTNLALGQEVEAVSSDHSIGALTITYTIFGAPYYIYSTMAPKPYSKY